MKRILIAAFASALLIGQALADFTAKDSTGATITFKNTGTCTSVVCVPAYNPVDNTGANFGVTGNPFFVSPGTGATFPVSGTFWQATQPVSVASLPLPSGAATAAGQTGGNFGGYDFQLAPTITVQNAAYSAGNSLGGLITVTGAARTNGGSGILDAIRLRSAGGATNTIWVYAWSKTPAATCTDKSAYVGNTADGPYSIPGFPTSVVLGGAPGAWDTQTYAQLGSLLSNFKNQDSSPGTAIYFCLVTAGSVTPATTSDLALVVGGVQD